MSFFPAYINFENKKILLIGAGKIALEKLEKLLDFTQEITILSEHYSDDFLSLVKMHQLIYYQRKYKEKDINGFDIVIVATDNKKLYEKIYSESRDSRVLINCVDNANYCDFIFPSYIKKGDLTISVSTSGASPAFAKQLRQYIEKLIPSSVENFLKEMKVLRQTLPKGRERMQFFEKKTKDFITTKFK